jgi:hypothetical protein
MPVHHTLEEYLDSYIQAAGIAEDRKGPLFRASNRKTDILSERPLDREDAFHMIRRRAAAAGIETKIGCHARSSPVAETSGRCLRSVRSAEGI